MTTVEKIQESILQSLGDRKYDLEKTVVRIFVMVGFQIPGSFGSN